MARKSRRQINARNGADLPKTSASPNLPRIKTGVYARLSLKDLGIENGDTMETQIALLRDFVIQHPELELTEVYEDNGFTGTNFHRPEFQHMLEDIRSGKIGCIVVKDFSRLGRNYMEAGMYIQNVFPSMAVRFISVNDYYDSSTSDPESMVVAMKNIVNDYYSRDLSKKISSAIDIKRMQGPHYLGPPPYGYEMSRRGAKHYVIDREAAPFVHLIFQWAKEGVSFHQIAANLTDMRVPTPTEHYNARQNKDCPAPSCHWNSGVIRKILLNQTYTGDFISNKSYFRKYDPANARMVPESEWIIYPDTHDAYISHEEFQALKERLTSQASQRIKSVKRHRCQQVNTENPFSDLLYCGECGRRLSPKGPEDARWIGCGGAANRTHVSHQPYRMDFRKMKNIVLFSLQAQLKLAVDTDRFLKRISMEEARKRLKSHRQGALQMLYAKQAEIRFRRQKAFEDLAENILDKDTYTMEIEKLTKEARWLEGDIARAKKRLEDVSTYFTLDNEWLRLFLSARISGELDSRAVHLLISRIEVWHDQQIRIVYRCADWMIQMQNYIKELTQTDTSVFPEKEKERRNFANG